MCGVENLLSSFLRFPLFSLGYFLKEIENTFFVFLSSYRNTREGLGELERENSRLMCNKQLTIRKVLCTRFYSLKLQISFGIYLRESGEFQARSCAGIN